MPNAPSSRAIVLLLAWLMMGSVVVLSTGATAQPQDAAAPAATVSSGPVSFADVSAPPTEPESSPSVAMEKIAPALQSVMSQPDKVGYVPITVHTEDVPAASEALARLGARHLATIDGKMRSVPYTARPWGAVGQPTTLSAQILPSRIAALSSVGAVLYLEQPRMEATELAPQATMLEDKMAFDNYIARLKAGAKDPAPKTTGTGGGVSPTSYGVVSEHKAWDAWQIDLGGGTYAMGDGVNVAIIDTGEDLAGPSMSNSYAVEQNPASPWFGWPIMFHPASMDALMGAYWTAPSDFDRLPIPYWLGANDGDSWYSNTDFVANDSAGSGTLLYQDHTANPFTGIDQRTPQTNPQGYGATCGGANTARISRNYVIGAPGEPWQIRSASGWYRLGVNRDDTLTGLWCGKVGVLLVDSTVPFQYDTVYVDLNYDFNFTDDKPVTKASPIANADLNGDGIPDISGGILYYIASSSPVTNEAVLTNIPAPSPATATLSPHWDLDGDGTPESASAATNMTGWYTWDPPIRLFLVDPVSGLRILVPGATEDVYEEFTGPATAGDRWQLGGAGTSFGPVNLINGQPIPSGRLLRGPGPDFSMSMIYDFELNGVPLVEGADYVIDMPTGEITWLINIAPTDSVYIIYQLATYVLEPVSGTIRFEDPVTGFQTNLPAGWDLVADYDSGLPIPYSQVYGPEHGYDTLIPGNGDLVAFHGEFDYGQSHGSFVSGTVAGHPFGNTQSTVLEVFGTAPHAKIMGIAACCNVPGPLGFFGSIEDQRTFAAVGYDGRPDSGDEAVIVSNSFGDPTSLNSGLSWEDRWLIDYKNRWPNTTILIAMANNGPGYATGTPGGTSPGAIGVAAGTSQDYRVLAGNDLGDAGWSLPDCTLAGTPPNPRLCVGITSPNGPGPYGQVADFSGRGPTMLGNPKPDITSIGEYAYEAGPMNVFGNVPADLDGNFAFDLFSGTSMATPVTSGIAALTAQAYRAAHGVWPTNTELRVLLKSGADDMHQDVLQTGAGWSNALRSVRLALDTSSYAGVGDGLTSSVDAWAPGNYQGVHRVGFANLLAPGSSDSITLTVTNRNPSVQRTVTVTDAMYQRAVAPFRYSYSAGTGSNQWIILRADGIYNADGNAKLDPTIDFQPYWTTADFVRVTFAYDSFTYTASTALRLDTFDWFDSNGNGMYDQDAAGCVGTPPKGCGERNRMTVVVPGADASSVWQNIMLPSVKTHTGWALNLRTGAGTPVPMTLIVEFYQKVNWPWITETGGGPFTLAALGNRPVTVTATVPIGTPAGYYEGAVYVTDERGETTTVPIVINVPGSGIPLNAGGNMPTTSLYDVNGVIQGSRGNGAWQQIGDSRYYWTNVSVVAAEGREMIFNAIMQGNKSDPEMFVFGLTADSAWTDDALYGPGTMAIRCAERDAITGDCTRDLATKNVLGGTNTKYPYKEFMHAPPPFSGLTVFQVKSWGSWGLDNGTEKFEANFGYMEVTPTAFNIFTNKLAGSVPAGIWANTPLYEGAAAAVTQGFVRNGGANLIAANPDYAPGGAFSNAWLCRQRTPNEIVVPARGAVISRSLYVHTWSPEPTDDHDMQIYLDVNGNGVCDDGTDILLAQSAGPTADEAATAVTTDGTKNLLIQIGIFKAGSNTFSYTWTDTVLQIGVSNFGLTAPTTTVPPYTPVQGAVTWNYPGNTPAGFKDTGVLFVSPGFAPYALAVRTSNSWTYDLTPVTIDRIGLSPTPDTTISNPYASVVANFADGSGDQIPGQIDRLSIRLIVDGVDVTRSSKLITPFSSATPPPPYAYSQATIAWEHAGYRFSDGPHSAITSAADFAGNVRTEVWTWTVDTTPPTIAITDPPSDVLTNRASWDFAARTDPGSTVTLRMNGVPQTITVSPDGVVTSTLALGTDGAYDVVITSADAIGNSASASRTIVRDSAVPVIQAGADVPPLTNRLSARIAGTVTKSVSEICASSSGLQIGCATVAADGTFSIVVPLVEGANDFTLTTTDAAGNQGSATLTTITRDTVAPAIAVDPLPLVKTSLADRNVTVTGTVDTNLLAYVTINGQFVVPDSSGRFSKTFPLAVGDNVFVVEAGDDAGNVAQAQVSVAYSPSITRETSNYNSIIASGVAVVLLIVGFVVGYLLSGRGGAGPAEAPPPAPAPKEEAMAEEELPPEEPRKPEEEEL